jgi:hypothetical protein
VVVTILDDRWTIVDNCGRGALLASLHDSRRRILLASVHDSRRRMLFTSIYDSGGRMLLTILGGL